MTKLTEAERTHVFLDRPTLIALLRQELKFCCELTNDAFRAERFPEPQPTQARENFIRQWSDRAQNIRRVLVDLGAEPITIL